MAVFDAERAVVAEIYNGLAGDSELQTLTGKDPVPVYLIWAEEDAGFPYLVHTVEIQSMQEGIVVPATYRIDAWDYSPNADRIYEIRRRIIELLDKSIVTADAGGEFTGLRLQLVSGGMVATDARNVWRYELAFSCRFVRKGELERVYGR